MLSKRRQLILTDAPRLFYIDPNSLAVMGEIPWSKDLKPQYRTQRLFFVHTVRQLFSKLVYTVLILFAVPFPC